MAPLQDTRSKVPMPPSTPTAPSSARTRTVPSHTRSAKRPYIPMPHRPTLPSSTPPTLKPVLLLPLARLPRSTKAALPVSRTRRALTPTPDRTERQTTAQDRQRSTRRYCKATLRRTALTRDRPPSDRHSSRCSTSSTANCSSSKTVCHLRPSVLPRFDERCPRSEEAPRMRRRRRRRLLRATIDRKSVV